MKKIIMTIVIMITPFLAYSLELPKQYLFTNQCIYAKELTPTVNRNFEIICIPSYKTKKRLKSSEILKKYRENGILDITATSSYVHFNKKSPIKIDTIKDSIKKYFLNYYPTLTINNIFITPRGYLKELPKHYTTIIQKKSFRSNSGTLYIESDNKRFYFDYLLDADITTVIASRILNKNEKLSSNNTKLHTQKFSKFRARPIDFKNIVNYETVHKIRKNRTITVRDIKQKCLVRRHEDVTAVIKESNLEIEFSAKAIEDGSLHEVIKIEKNDGTRLNAKVIGYKRVEI